VTRNEATTCSPWFPPPGPLAGSALPSTGSAEMRSPASMVLWRCPTPCAPLAVLGCLRPAIPCGASVGSLPSVQTRGRGPGVHHSGPHRRKVSAGRRSGPPRFPCNPLSLCPVLRPRQDRKRQALAARRRGPRYVHGEGSHESIQLSRLNRTAWGLAVYASPDALPRRTQNSLPAAGQALPDGIGYPQGCYERFLTTSSSFHELSWRKDIQGCFSAIAAHERRSE